MFEIKKTDAGITYVSNLIPELEHYFTTRESNVDDNFEKWVSILSVTNDNFIHPNQTHSSNIRYAQKRISIYKETDALILNNYEQAIYLRFADCTPIILYDKQNNIGAIVHAGWRGTVESIVTKTTKKLLDKTDKNINNIYAVIGPAIGSCCYKVGDDVINRIKNSVSDYSQLYKEINNELYVDLKRTNMQQLLEVGVKPENIDICPYCTSCNNGLFFSYRKENGTQKRHNAIIKLKNIV